MSSLMTAGNLIPYARVAVAASLEPWALQRLEQARFRSEENFREVQGRPFLTIAGVRRLAEVLKLHGYASRAHSLQVLANQLETRPAQRLPGRAQPSAPYAWQKRADLA